MIILSLATTVECYGRYLPTTIHSSYSCGCERALGKNQVVAHFVRRSTLAFATRGDSVDS